MEREWGRQGAGAQGHAATEENASPPSGRRFLVLMQLCCRRKKQRSRVVRAKPIKTEQATARTAERALSDDAC